MKSINLAGFDLDRETIQTAFDNAKQGILKMIESEEIITFFRVERVGETVTIDRYFYLSGNEKPLQFDESIQLADFLYKCNTINANFAGKIAMRVSKPWVMRKMEPVINEVEKMLVSLLDEYSYLISKSGENIKISKYKSWVDTGETIEFETILETALRSILPEEEPEFLPAPKLPFEEEE